ncbi:hypothetical protein FJZ33_07370, partial [Candidatus Poribacteria bacterium]|nr:hypothetical protein [Candidatus Poribacteria bacterium]
MKKVIFLVSILLIGLLCNTKEIFCCGPFFESPVFTYNLNPDIPLDNFPKGNLGVILPSFARSYLYVAYRQLNGKGFSQEEQNALLDFWITRLRLEWRDTGENMPEIWLSARSKVPQAGPSPKINVYSDESYSAYLRYTEDAFKNAASTLEDRIKKFGPDSSQILEWVKAQDMVFSGSIPEPLEIDTDPLIRADRAYQVAAANFYAGNFDLTIEMFKEIAKDNSSPWQKIAPYLVARTLIRKATLNTESSFDRELLTKAFDQLKMILDDKALKDMHQASRKLLGFVNYRLEPNITLHELSKTLMNEKPGDDIRLYLGDYVKLLDIFMNEQDESVFWWTPEEREKSRIDALQKLEKSAVNDDLTDWIITFQSTGDIALNRSLEKWKKSQSLHWLIASLVKINGSHPEVPKLLSEGEKIKGDSPAFPTVAFHSI